MKLRGIALAMSFCLFLNPFTLDGQSVETQGELETISKSPKGAFFRSLLLPGWGHHYLGANHKRRARFHFGAEVILIASYFGIQQRVENMEDRMFSYADAQIGIDLSRKNRAFQLAVAQYNSLQEYNDFMERSRNWDQILPNTSENQWYWSDDQSRERYVQLRDDRERANQQLPGLLSLMVVNRLFSGLNAFTAARKMDNMPQFSLQSNQAQSSFLVTAKFDF